MVWLLSCREMGGEDNLWSICGFTQGYRWSSQQVQVPAAFLNVGNARFAVLPVESVAVYAVLHKVKTLAVECFSLAHPDLIRVVSAPHQLSPTVIQFKAEFIQFWTVCLHFQPVIDSVISFVTSFGSVAAVGDAREPAEAR